MKSPLQKDLFQLSAEMEWEEAGPGIQRKVYGHDEQIMVVRVRFEAGSTGVPHQHPHRQVSLVESGVFELTIDGQKKILKKGDGYFVPPDVLHGCVCIEAGVLVDVFTPQRADFLS